MAWAQDMKNLAADIKTSHQDRAARLSEIKDETKEIRKQGQQILRDADAFMKRVRTELNDAAKNLKNFLAESEGTRKKDFEVLLKGIQAQIKEIKGDVKDFLAKSEEKRMADFKALMKDVTGAVDTIKKSTKDLLGSYGAERKEATRYWTGAGGGEEAEEVTSAPKRGGKRGRPRGRGKK